jgi:hypothetical protein
VPEAGYLQIWAMCDATPHDRVSHQGTRTIPLISVPDHNVMHMMCMSIHLHNMQTTLHVVQHSRWKRTDAIEGRTGHMYGPTLKLSLASSLQSFLKNAAFLLASSISASGSCSSLHTWDHDHTRDRQWSACI